MRLNLIESINRQKKLMGILLENTNIIGKLVNVIDELLTNNKKFFSDIDLPTNETTFLQKKGINNLEEFRAAISGGLKKGLTHEQVGKIYKVVISNLAENMGDVSFDPITKKILPDIFDALSPEQGARLTNEYNKLIASKDNLEKIKFLNLLREIRMGESTLKFVQRTLKITSDEVVSSKDIWDSFFDGVKMSLTSVPLIKNIPIVKQKLLKLFKQGLKSFYDLQNKFIGLLNEYKMLVEKDPAKADELIDEITVTLNQMTIVSGNSKKIIYENWKKELPPDWFKTLGDIDDPGFRDVFSKFEKGVAKIEPTDVLVSRWDAFWKIFKRPPYADAKWYFWDKYFVERMSNLGQRLVGLAIGMDARKLSEHKINKMLLGTNRWLGKGTSDRILTAVLYYPIAYALYKTLGEYVEGKEWFDVPGISREDAKKHIGDKDSGFTNLWRVFTDNLVNGYFSSKDHYTKIQSQSPLLAAIFANVYSVSQEIETPEDSRTIRQRIRDEWVRDSTATRRELDSLRNKVNEEQKRILDSIRAQIPTNENIDTMVNSVENVEY